MRSKLVPLHFNFDFLTRDQKIELWQELADTFHCLIGSHQTLWFVKSCLRRKHQFHLACLYLLPLCIEICGFSFLFSQLNDCFFIFILIEY
jgi:hypothetical protein